MIPILVAAALAFGCSRPASPVTTSHVVNLAMNGLTLGQERVETTIDGQREASEIETTFSGPPGFRLAGRLVIERGRPVLLEVKGESPASLPSEVDVTSTGDRTDTFLMRSPLPVHVLATLVRRSMVGSRSAFRLLPEGRVEIAPCSGVDGPYTDATCHAVSGMASGPALVWLDRRQVLAAAVIQTPFGVLLATATERDDTHAALLEQFDVYSRVVNRNREGT